MNHETERTTRSLSRRWVVPVLAGVGVVGIGALVILMAFRDSERQGKRDSPQRGVSCVHLREASDALDAGDSERVDEAVTQAARAAETSLETSGQLFGRPERVAIEVRHLINSRGINHPEVVRWMEKGLRACRALA